MGTAMMWFWSLWCSWPDVIPCACWVMCRTLLSCGLHVSDQLPCHFSCMSPPLTPTPHITCNSPSHFQAPCFLSISLLCSTQPRHVLCCVWSEHRLQGCHQLMHSCFTVTATHLHPSDCQHCYHYTNMLPLGSCIACSSWTHYTLEWRQHDHLKCQEPSISECSATYTRFESTQFILFYDCHYGTCCRRDGSMIWQTCQMS